jgi:hypothetical protein
LFHTTIYDMEQRGKFPQRVYLTSRCVVWTEVEAWVEMRREASKAKAINRAPSPDVHQRKTSSNSSRPRGSCGIRSPPEHAIIFHETIQQGGVIHRGKNNETMRKQRRLGFYTLNKESTLLPNYNPAWHITPAGMAMICECVDDATRLPLCLSLEPDEPQRPHLRCGGARQDEWQARQIRGRLHRGDQSERDPTPQNADRCERTIMKTISLWLPWASLIAACGAKPYETGSFAPPASLIGQSMRFMLRRKSIRAPLNSPKS